MEFVLQFQVSGEPCMSKRAKGVPSPVQRLPRECPLITSCLSITACTEPEVSRTQVRPPPAPLSNSAKSRCPRREVELPTVHVCSDTAAHGEAVGPYLGVST
jgi:hypothetical protein